MTWEKKGLIYYPRKKYWWNQLYAIIPTPVLLPGGDVIRIYFSTTCADRFGRVTYIDVNAHDPGTILYEHNDFILDTGAPGTFDDCGVNVTSVNLVGDTWYLYYAGYQRHFRVPYSILSGIAESRDGIHFERNSTTPFLERTPAEMNLRSAPSVLFEQGIYKMWYVAGNGWKKMEGGVHDGRLMPTYSIMYATSGDNKNWQFSKSPILELEEEEFGFGRPYIYKAHDGYLLFYSIRSRTEPYKLGMARSADGLSWTRCDKDLSLQASTDGWDSQMICYPAVITCNEKTFLFYNGNNNGETGFGYAQLTSW